APLHPCAGALQRIAGGVRRPAERLARPRAGAVDRLAGPRRRLPALAGRHADQAEGDEDAEGGGHRCGNSVRQGDRDMARPERWQGQRRRASLRRSETREVFAHDPASPDRPRCHPRPRRLRAADPDPGGQRRVRRPCHARAARRGDQAGRRRPRLGDAGPGAGADARHAQHPQPPGSGRDPVRHAPLQHPLRHQHQSRLHRQHHPPELQQLGAQPAERDRRAVGRAGL
ncbi:MAG: hypothetical protein AVDCRST_MAG27-4151, partial [uncultured Craurococcus sp.]